MTATLTLALAQLNPIVGDVVGAAARIRSCRERAAARGADVVLCPEMALCGYPVDDLVNRPDFLELVQAQALALAQDTADGGPALIVGTPWRLNGETHNVALIMDAGDIQAVTVKRCLPNYGVFEENRTFTPGPRQDPRTLRGACLGVMICEDMWSREVARDLAHGGAGILVVINASPYDLDKAQQRRDAATARTRETGLPLVYVNQVGGHDELAFDGASFVVDHDGLMTHRAPTWTESLTLTRWRQAEPARWLCQPAAVAATPGRLEGIYQALVTGLGDYVNKNGFPGVVLGLSGGIDSALAATIAVDALGPERVRCVMMPSPHTSTASVEDAAATAHLLGTSCDQISITPAMETFDKLLTPVLGNHDAGTTTQNIQARCRGLMVMALSNTFGLLALATGNKSELSVGYATLYGDMCGGYAVLKNVYKTVVFELCHWRNTTHPPRALGPEGPAIPERVIVKPPSAELAPGQKDEDSLPPYHRLDTILGAFIEEHRSAANIVATHGFDAAEVEHIWRLLNRAEYKRRQAPPGVKITACSFGRERRYPITNGFASRQAL